MVSVSNKSGYSKIFSFHMEHCFCVVSGNPLYIKLYSPMVTIPLIGDTGCGIAILCTFFAVAVVYHFYCCKAIYGEIYMSISNESYGTMVADFINSQRALSRTLGEASSGCSEELMRISMVAVKTGLAESIVFTRQLMTAVNASDRFELISARMQARIESSLSLTQRISDICFNARSQMSDAVQRQIEVVKPNVDGIENNVVIAAIDGLEIPAEVTEPVVINAQQEPDNLIRLEKNKLQIDKI
ncbi:phasin family protein [Glaciimonas sp. CA11.2]|uniref:phasin family protein n=1 Tax=Glaciimonas sp. CA11.2 TaxID=3048601 RepID=UPI002AB53FFE|nr:phasin family protein [Glaciimonas sp. CA11.2]MDY7547016.1 phasin family protein [Glaciimonas sp. CA11.2]MEB0163286.1 phasin family protein [Glaciimonas sp. CA11.2]